MVQRVLELAVLMQRARLRSVLVFTAEVSLVPFGSLAPADIDSSLVFKIVEPFWHTKTVTAGRVLNRIAVDYELMAHALEGIHETNRSVGRG